MKKIIHVILLIAVVFLASCEDFIEKDITKSTVNLLSPMDGYISSSLTNTYWWDELEGAENYQIQIVKGTFANIIQYVVDSTIAFNRFDFTLSQPGSYQWRVRALNNGYETVYSLRSVVIDSTSDLSGQIIGLISPAENLVQGSSQVTFQWSGIFNAEVYRFQLLDSIGGIIKDTALTPTSVTLTINKGNYSWRVRAENSSSVSPYTMRNFTIDQTAPQAPVCVSPTLNDTVIAPFDLTWTHDSSINGDSLYVYTDSLNTIIFLRIFTTNTSHEIDTITTGKYYWRVKSFDVAGNASAFSTISSFFIQ
jgi:hypothetical protein